MTNNDHDPKPLTLWGWLTGQGDPIVATSRLTVALSILVILSAGILGFTALRDLFIAMHLLNPILGYLFPILFDAAEVNFAVTTLNAQLQGDDDPFAWWMVIIFTFLGIMANVAHAVFAGISGLITFDQTILAIIFTSLFPLSIALVTHNLQNSIRRQIKRSNLIITLARLSDEIEQQQSHLYLLEDQQTQLEQSQGELQEQIEAERSTFAQQKIQLEQELSVLKAERRTVKHGTRQPVETDSAEPTADLERKAYAFLAEQVRQGKRNSDITGAELGRAIGTSDSYGRRLKNRLLDQVRHDLGIPEPATQANGTHPTD